MITILCLLKIVLLAVLVFLLLTYTIYLYERTNQDGIQIKRLVSLVNFFRVFRLLTIEYLSLLLSLILWPFGFFNIREGEPDAGGRKPVLLLHGLMLNRSCWAVTKLRLRLQGITDVHTINLPPTRDIETLTEKVALKVDALRLDRNCAQVHLVAHSMGGIIARNYIQIRGGADKVDQCLLLGSPHHGSKLAPFALTLLAESIMPGSEFLLNLNKKAIPQKVTMTNIFTRHDNIVIPPASARLDKATNIELSDRGHNTLLYDNTVFNHVLATLKNADAADDSDQKPE